MYDIIIIGAGPAGISAGIYAVSRGKKAVILEKNEVGGLIGKVSTVTHYVGVSQGETGYIFAEKLKTQAENAGIEIRKEDVIEVELKVKSKKFGQQIKNIRQKKLFLPMELLPEC